MCVCASALITCSIITSRKLLPWNVERYYTLVDLGLDGFLSTTEATMSSSVAQLRARGTEEQREQRRDADRERKRQK